MASFLLSKVLGTNIEQAMEVTNDPAIVTWLNKFVPQGNFNNLKVSRDVFNILIDKDGMWLHFIPFSLLSYTYIRPSSMH